MSLAILPMTTVTARRKSAEHASPSGLGPVVKLAALPCPREYHRAPRGGVVLAGKFYRGGCFTPRPKPTPAHALAVDVTRDDFTVAITNIRTGNTRRFRVATIRTGKWAGNRVAMVADESRDFEWFAWADDFGLRPLARLAADPRVAGPNGYVALLTESARFAARGIRYQLINV